MRWILICLTGVLALCGSNRAIAESFDDVSSDPRPDNRTDVVSQSETLFNEVEKLVDAGDLKSALLLAQQVLRLRREAFGDQDPQTIDFIGKYALILNSLGRREEAKRYFAEALYLNQEAFGERHPDALTSLHNYVHILLALGEFKEAERFASQLLSWRREVLGLQHADTFQSQGAYAASLAGLGRHREALPLIEEALTWQKEELGPEHTNTLELQTAYALTLFTLGRFSEAEPVLREVQGSFSKLLGAQHQDTLTVAGMRGMVLVKLGRMDEAEAIVSEALRTNMGVLGQRHPSTISSMQTYSGILFELGRWDEAISLTSEILRFYREQLGDTNPLTLVARNNHIVMLMETGRSEEALLLSSETLRTLREHLGEAHHAAITSLSNHAALLAQSGRGEEAIRHSAEALRLTQDAFGEVHPETIEALDSYALSLNELNRMREAEPLAAEALRLSRAALGQRHPKTIRILNNYAHTLSAIGRAEEAVGLYAEALELNREVLGGRHPSTMTVLSNYAMELVELGRAVEAEPLAAEAMRQRHEVLGPDHPDTLLSMSNWAYSLTLIGQTAEGEALALKALRLKRETLGDRHPLTVTSLRNHTYALHRDGRSQDSLPFAREMVKINRLRMADLAQGSMQHIAQRTREIDDRQWVEQLFVDVLWDNHASGSFSEQDLIIEAYTALQLSSAGSTSRAVADAAAARYASAAGLQEVVQERRSLVKAWEAAERSLLTYLIEGDATHVRTAYRKRLGAIEERLEKIDEQLSTDAPRYLAIQNRDAVSLEQLRGILGDDEAVLLLVPTEHGTHSMALTRDGIAWQRSERDRTEIASAVAEFRNGLEIQSGEAYLPDFNLEQAHQLYRELIAPVEDTLEDMTRVYVVADGALSRLPISTLITSPPPTDATNESGTLRQADWLADRYALVQLPSLQSLVYVRTYSLSEASGDWEFTGFGEPMLQGEARLRGARSATLAPIDAATLVDPLSGSSVRPLMQPEALRNLSALPGTRAEIEQVRLAVGAEENSIYLADRMTETAIRNIDLSGTTILHLATHAFTSEQAGTLAEPGLVFTPPVEARREDDGYLAASEVVGIDLSSASWVILSACNTASPSGKPGGTALSGLAQAFFYAGAESLLVSHWPVFDDIAPILTVETLRRNEQGMPKAEALQAAMRHVRNNPELDAAHPAVWAPFTVVGEGR